ncbi:hypothetical protein [Amycolatopsis alba]|uniref:Uncharacterized protein n=1 Tax=Amycolatopsis alba DSM 44262 TaxID=1125972 RepID=A0A229RG28_AMYAL|nr:hypothetical protein [Amycolatopsis alba]OXM45622.1 hypothetical protein CFP75_30295 [Amycolatopsis alba DSM 44262]
MPDYVDGDPEAMAAYSGKLKAPALPGSLARPGSGLNVTGLFEGIAMTLLDKAATAEMTAFLAKITEDLATDSVKVKAIAAGYTAADAASALKLAASSFKVAEKGLSLLKQASSSISQAPQSQNASTETPAADGSQASV